MKITTLLYSLIYLCAWVCGCGDDDSDFINYTSVIPDLITIQDNQAQFQVNDTIYFTVQVPKNLTTIENENIDILEVTDTEIGYSYFSLFKQTNFDNPSPVLLSDNEIFSTSGLVSIFDETLSIELNLQDEEYAATIGIVLKEEGDYFFGKTSNSSPNLYITFSGQEFTSVTVKTSFLGGNEENQYTFSVK